MSAVELELRHCQARHWLEAQAPRIKRALEARQGAFYRRLVDNPHLTWRQRHRLADAKDELAMRLLRAIMRGAAQAYLDGGQRLGEEFLELALPVVARPPCPPAPPE